MLKYVDIKIPCLASECTHNYITITIIITYYYYHYYHLPVKYSHSLFELDVLTIIVWKRTCINLKHTIHIILFCTFCIFLYLKALTLGYQYRQQKKTQYHNA